MGSLKISVVTPAYNSAATIADTIESVLSQTYANVEHIIVDGASTDDTVEIVKSYESRYGGRLRWVSEADGGLYDAMNKGIEMATGDVVGILNSDDFFTSEDVLAVIAENMGDVDAVYGDVHYVSPDNLSREVRYYSSRRFRRWHMRFGFMPAHPSFYCRRSVYERMENYDLDFRVAADFDLLLRYIFIGGISSRYIKRDFVTMRTGGASTSGMESHRRILSEHLRSYRKNGIPSGLLHESVRYAIKTFEIVSQRISRLLS